MSKPPYNFKPAPRPARDPDLARRMAEESADLGFSRTTSAPKIEPADQSSEGPTAPLPEGASEPSPEGAIGHLPQEASAPSSEGPSEPLANEPTAQEADEATAPAGEGERAPSRSRAIGPAAERPKGRRGNAPTGRTRNPTIARANDGAVAQLAKGNFAPIAGTVKLDVQDPLWTELRVQAARRRVSIRYLVHEALEMAGYPVDLSLIPEDGRRER